MKKTSLLLILVLAGALAGLAADKKSEGRLLAYWNFDEGEGELCRDSSGNGHDLKIENKMRGVSWTDGRQGKALHFIAEKKNERNKAGAATAVKNFSYDFSTGFTLEMWVHMDQNAETRRTYCLFNNSPGNYGPGFNFTYNWGGLELCSGELHKREETYWNVRAPMPPSLQGKWIHLAATFNGQEARIYINGECKATKTNVKYYGRKFLGLTIGSGWKGLVLGFPGIIDSVKVYNYARTPEEIVQTAKFDM